MSKRNAGSSPLGPPGEHGDEVRPETWLQSEQVSSWIWDSVKPEELKASTRDRLLGAAHAGSERRLVRAAAAAVRPAAGEMVGGYLARIRTAAGASLEDIARYSQASVDSLRTLERIDRGLAGIGPAAFAALIDLLDFPFENAVVSAQRGLGGWQAAGGLRSARQREESHSPEVEQYLEETVAALRERGREDLLGRS